MLHSIAIMSAVAPQDLARVLRAISTATGFNAEAETTKSLKKQDAGRLGLCTLPNELTGKEGEEEAANRR